MKAVAAGAQTGRRTGGCVARRPHRTDRFG